MTGGRDALLLGSSLSKRFRHVTALDDVTLELSVGAAVALLGPNGAGKTTLLRILAGVSAPTSGRVTIGDGAGPRIGWVPQTPAVYRKLTTRENLRLFCALEGADEPAVSAEALLARADLTAFADRPAGDLSTGTLQRLNLAVALAGDPSLLLLDEPTAALSPDQVRRIWTWLDELRSGGDLTVLFSTQSVDEAARHAESIVILNRGQVAFAGTVSELIERQGAVGDRETDAAERAFLDLVGAAA
jgi:ABC-2 type transport system ATP-binding protein